MLGPPLVADAAALPPPPAVTPDLAGVAALVRWAANAPLRGHWAAERQRAEFCARTPAQIRADGTLDWTAPCHDLVSLLAPALIQAGLAPTLVLGGIRRPLQPVKFQCGLELVLPGTGTVVVGFGVSCAWLYPGRFEATRRRPWVERTAPLEAWDEQRPLLTWFEPEGRAALARRFAGYDPPRHLQQHLSWSRSLLRWWLARRKARDAAYATRPGRVPGAGGRWL